MENKTRHLILFLLVNTFLTGYCQVNYIKNYDTVIEDSEIYNGAIYNKRYRAIHNTHVFFERYKSFKSYIRYKNQQFYTDLKYDIYNDLIIVKYLDNTNPHYISLNPILIDKFELNNLKFVRLSEVENLSTFYKNGLFEEVYNKQNLSLYIKHLKFGKETYENEKLRLTFVNKQVYIIKTNGTYNIIKNRKHLIKVFPKDVKRIKRHFKKRKKITKKLLLSYINIKGI